VYSVAFSPDGKTIASGFDDRTIREVVCEMMSGAVLAFSSDGKTLASGSILLTEWGQDNYQVLFESAKQSFNCKSTHSNKCKV